MQIERFKEYDKFLKRKCDCGGNPHMFIDTVGDYFVRCEKCHEATYIHMDIKDAVEAWENNECRGPVDLLTDNLEKHLKKIKSIHIAEDYFFRVNEQSCDCMELVIDTGEKLISTESYGGIGFAEIDSYNEKYYRYKVDLSNKNFTLDKIWRYKNGKVETIRYSYGDTYLFIFSSDNDMIVTMSKYDLSEETQADFPENEATLEIEDTLK